MGSFLKNKNKKFGFVDFSTIVLAQKANAQIFTFDSLFKKKDIIQFLKRRGKTKKTDIKKANSETGK